MVTLSNKLDQALVELEGAMDEIDTLSQAAKAIRAAMHRIRLELVKSVVEGLRSELEQMELAQSASKPASQSASAQQGNNYQRVVAFLKSKGNVAQTRDELVAGARIPKGSLSALLYNTHPNEFEKVKTGQGKTLAWKLRNGI